MLSTIIYTCVSINWTQHCHAFFCYFTFIINASARIKLRSLKSVCMPNFQFHFTIYFVSFLFFFTRYARQTTTTPINNIVWPNQGVQKRKWLRIIRDKIEDNDAGTQTKKEQWTYMDENVLMCKNPNSQKKNRINITDTLFWPNSL